MVRRRTADLIARDAELGELRAMVDAARAGEPRGVLVCGPAGVGKSRLVEESVRRCLRNEDLLLVGHCVDLYGEEIPYAAVAEALRRLVRDHGPDVARHLLGAAARTLSALVPDLANESDNGRRALPSTSGDGAGMHVLEAFITGLEHASRGSGRVVWLWLEDLHWADRATLTLVSYLLRVAGPPNLLLVATVRTEDPASPGAGDVVAELLQVPKVDQLILRPFTRVQVAEHLEALTGSRPRPDVVDEMTSLCGGLPFYTELLAREWTPGRPVPNALRAMVRGEVEGLAGDAQAIVQAACVESGRLPHDVLVAVGGGGSGPLGGIADAVSASVLVSEPDGSGYRFRHALLRESVEAALLPADRRRWHAGWAEQLESVADSTGDPFARIAAAHHWAGAGDSTRALDAVMRGARLALELYVVADSVGLLVKALQLWPSVPDAEVRAGIDRETLLRVVLSLGLSQGGSVLAKTLEVARPIDGKNQLRDLFMTYTRKSIDGLNWRPMPDEVNLVLNAPLSDPWLPRVAVDLPFFLEEVDPDTSLVLADRAVQAAELAVRAVRESGREHMAWKSLITEWDLLNAEFMRAHAVFVVQGRADDAARFYADLRPRCEAVSASAALDCDMAMADALAALGRHRDAYAIVSAALAALPQHRQAPAAYGNLTYIAADAQIASGDWDDALSGIDVATRELDDDSYTYRIRALAGLVHCWRGNLHSAARHASVARGYLDAAEINAGLGTWEVAWLEAELAAAHSDIRRLRTVLAPLWSLPHPETASHALWRPLMTAVKANVDEIIAHPARSRDEALDDLATCQAVATRLHKIGDVGAAWHLHLTAEVSRLDGPDDPTRWAEAAEAWAAAGWLRERALALLGLAIAHLRAGADERAHVAMEEAISIAHQLGARPLQATAEEITQRARLGTSAGVGRQAGLNWLTPRELEVLALIARGYNNNRIAAELFISPKTAAVHVSRILAKLHATSRTEAVAIAQETILLSDANDPEG